MAPNKRVRRLASLAAALALALAMGGCRQVPPPRTPVPEPSKQPSQPMSPLNPSAEPARR
jgi:hypothetical protein